MKEASKRAAEVPILNWSAPPYKNPLEKKFGADFFKRIPLGPGVYFFKDAEGEILYVGKAKRLKHRLATYRRAKPGREAKKILRMLARTESIEWEECRSEKAALLRENELLRELAPEFNVLNTTPERYYFVGLRFLEPKHPLETLKVQFRLTRQPEKDLSFTHFGCYRSRRRLKEGYGALLRLVWCSLCEDKRFSMPARLARESPPYDYTLPFPEPWIKSLESFFDGRSLKLLVHVTEGLLSNLLIPDFMRSALQRDLKTARDFFKMGPKLNRRLRLHHGPRDQRVIEQDEIDDLIVLDAARRGLIEG